MEIFKYEKFIESYSYSKIISCKDQFIKELESLIDYILKGLVYDKGKVIYKDGFDNIDVEQTITNCINKFSEEVVEFFNLEPFLRKINQLVQFKRAHVKKKIRDEFLEYCISIDKRLEKLKDEPKREYDLEDFIDSEEGEESVLPRKIYEREKREIQIELLKLQNWVMETKQRVAIVFEGRDAAGKGSTIKRFTEYLNPKGFRIQAFGIPTNYEKRNWFNRYEKAMPKSGEIVFFDRSWYTRAVTEISMGYCTEEQYTDFMEKVNDWEENLIKDGIILIKFWFSITKTKQLDRFEARKSSPLKYWKFSENDLKSMNKWDVVTFYKNQMFDKTSTNDSPWVIVNSSDKRVSRLNSMRYVLNVIDYPDKNYEVCKYYPEIISVLK